jgi:hypothetical protein
MNFKDMLEKISQLSEATKDTGKGKIHTADAGGYGRKYDTDEEGDEVKKKDKEPAAKRGKGRPKKGADDSGEVKKYDSSALSKVMGGGKHPKKEVGKTSVKHTLKDWFEHMEQEMIAEAALAVQPIPNPKPQGQSYMIKDPANPAAAAITTSDPAVVDAAKKGTLAMHKPGASPSSSQATPSSSQVAPLEEKDIGKHNNATTGFDALVRKLTPKYGVEAAKRIAGSQLKKIKEADIPSMSGVDTEGANLGAGRNPDVLESKKTVKKDDKAEKAGKKVTKDIEYDEKVKDKIHGKKRGAEDAKAERAGKKVAKDIEYDMKKKKTVKEGISHNIAAARLEGKSHALSKMPYSCRHHGMEESRAYHDGFKEGLDECYGQMPVQGLVRETEGTTPAATTPGMASQAMAGGISESSDSCEAARNAITNRILRQHSDLLSKYGPVKVMAAIEDACEGLNDLEEIGSSDVSAWVHQVTRELQSGAYNALDEMDKTAYMKQQAIKTPGDTFKAFGQTMHDKDVLENDFAFEAWDKELQNLLTEGEGKVAEGLTVSVSKGQQGSPDSVSINASDAEADQVLAFIKQAGLGLFGDESHSDNLPVAVGSGPVEIGASTPKIDVVDDHEGMMALMKKMTGGDDHGHAHGSEDYADEEDSCNECGMAYESCGCDKEMVDEVQSEDQMEFEVAEANAPDSEEAEHASMAGAEAEEDSALATAASKNFANTDAPPVQEDGDEASEEPEEDMTQGGTQPETEDEDENMSESFRFESLYKKLTMLSEESTAEKDDKAERAAKKVAKDIEYDEGHKGKDDDKAERAGKKVKKDIEYDDKKDKKLDEWANDAGPGKTVSDTTFEQDIDFMTKIISGGLNKQKSTGQTTIPVVSTQLNRMHSHNTTDINESTVNDWKKLAGIK